MSKKTILISASLIIIATISGLYFYIKNNNIVLSKPIPMEINLLPMYGGENIIKTPSMLQADQDFIYLAIKASGSREQASIDITNKAAKLLINGDLDNAMRRFNQAWLLNPNNPEPYKGFAEILKQQGKIEEAEGMLIIYKGKE